MGSSGCFKIYINVRVFRVAFGFLLRFGDEHFEALALALILYGFLWVGA